MSHTGLGLPATLGLVGLLGGLGPAQGAASLSGTWEVQSMGGDRLVEIEQRGPKLIAHRVLWPEFEGAKYKLEHLYRGTIVGNEIKGELLVKEDALPDFEILRPFVGRIRTDRQITVDGLPMKRTGELPPSKVAPPEPPPTAPGRADRPTEPPPLAKAEPTRPPPPSPPPPPAAAEPGDEDPGVSLFANIMGTPGMGELFTVSARIEMPDNTAALIREGDQLYTSKDFAGALRKYEAARQAGAAAPVQLLHRMGRCHLRLKHFAEAEKLLRRATRLDPHDRRIRRDYRLAKKKAR